MMNIMHTTDSMEAATSMEAIKAWSSDNIKKELLKPMLLYLKELRGKNIEDQKLGTKEEIDKIRLFNNLYLQLTRENSKSVKFFENGMILESQSPDMGPTIVLLTSGELYYINKNHTEAVKKAKKELEYSLATSDNDNITAKAKDSVLEARKNVVIDRLILNLEKAMGIQDTMGEPRYSLRPLDPNLNSYDHEEIQQMIDKKYNQR